MNLSCSLSQNCEPQHPPPFEASPPFSSVGQLLPVQAPPSFLLLRSFSWKRAADYGGSVISSPMSVVPTSPLKDRFWFLSFTLAVVTGAILDDENRGVATMLRSPTPRLELL
ncbi:hypothetical protein D8674_012708 [Pyrus ussuriensis x Pyrus communis]|uniref:Uncharacterized protein n=1 Tax=Pyrus ussuriensis x Pyrus communis TaxID=2448454 RepID=A0A5N5G753_9ROSA|nr:hypothetical protein D8674_012708 [Pyrus ussuriensis x Pyrus communis]